MHENTKTVCAGLWWWLIQYCRHCCHHTIHLRYTWYNVTIGATTWILLYTAIKIISNEALRTNFKSDILDKRGASMVWKYGRDFSTAAIIVVCSPLSHGPSKAYFEENRLVNCILKGVCYYVL